MELDKFKVEWLDEIRANAKIKQITPQEEFLETTLELLEQQQELNSPQIIDFYKVGSNNRVMQADAYGFDESTHSLSIILLDFNDSYDNPRLIKTKIDTLVNRALAFLDSSYHATLSRFCDDSDEIIKIGNEINRRMTLKTTNSKIDESIERINIFILSNSQLSDRVKTMNLEDFYDFKVKVKIYSLDRIKDIYESGFEKEPITIIPSDYNMPNGIPCVLADMTHNDDYDAYLAILPGRFLAEVYYDYDSRLLEGNVRAFLSTRGNVNRGIRRTILQEPTKFFAYNNGISTTAKSIKLMQTKQGLFITEIEDFQIINGGQTTASLTSAMIADKNNLDDIFVQMKLTVVKNEEYEDMISKIALYANSQNRVTRADLFSNHPYHIQMERLSEKVRAPETDFNINETVWFYERSRGKYEQKQFKISTKVERDNFFRKYPKNQVIKKEDLAKYINTFRQKPHIVSRGAMKNMLSFAEDIDKIWKLDSSKINEYYFKQAIAITIIFRSLDKHIMKLEWYEKGGYKANIVTYTIAKIISSIPQGYAIDFDKIWKRQTISTSFYEEFDIVGKKTKDFILDSKGIIVTEYCKKEETWKRYKEVPHKLSSAFISELINEEHIISREKIAKKEEKLTSKVIDSIKIFELGSEYFEKLILEAEKFADFTPFDRRMLLVAAKIDHKKIKTVPSHKQLNEIVKVMKKLEDLGVVLSKD